MPLLLTVTFTLPDGRSGAVQITVLSFTYIAATADKPNRQYKLREKTNPVPCTVTAVDVPTGPNNGRIKSTATASVKRNWTVEVVKSKSLFVTSIDTLPERNGGEIHWI